MFQKIQSRSGNTKCNGCDEYIKTGDDMISLGKFGGWHSMRWIKICRNCVHKAYKQLFNY